MRLLCIANPAACASASTDVPLSYARLAAHPEVELFHAETDSLLRPGNRPGDRIDAVRVEAGFAREEFGELSSRSATALGADFFDVALCRTLKPFPLGYIARLNEWSRALLFVNHPAGIERQLHQEFFVEAASEFMPPAVLTADRSVAGQFLEHHQTIVAKRSNSCGGRGVFKVFRTNSGDFASDNVVEGTQSFAAFSELFDHVSVPAGDPVLLVRYLPRVTEGDKRIIVVDGRVIGAYGRKSARGHWVQNVSFGATCERVSVSDEEREIVRQTCRPYGDAGIHLLGYDLLQDDDGTWKVSEINAGNIGGIFRLEEMGVERVTDRFVSWLQAFAERSGNS